VTNVETVITDVEIVIVYDGICLCCERDRDVTSSYINAKANVTCDEC
jgi:hypothetical protein